jgi:hypothetical protein
MGTGFSFTAARLDRLSTPPSSCLPFRRRRPTLIGHLRAHERALTRAGISPAQRAKPRPGCGTPRRGFVTDAVLSHRPAT